MSITTSDYWAALDFSFIVTYSFNRGHRLDSLSQAAQNLYRATRRKLLIAPSEQILKLRKELEQLKRVHDLSLLTLTENLASFHITATPVIKIESDDANSKILANILRAPISEKSNWMCAPVYRDAFAFYDAQENLISVLNVCFDCDRMLTDANQEVEADEIVYQKLRNYLNRLGHSVTDT